MSTPLDIDAVVLINEALTGNRCSEERKQRVGGCLSSYSYYDTVREQNTGRRVESISANDSGSTNDTKSDNTNHSTTNNSTAAHHTAAHHTARITKTYPRYRRSNRTHRYDDGHSRRRTNGNRNCADSKKRTEKIKFVTKVKYRFFIGRPL